VGLDGNVTTPAHGGVDQPEYPTFISSPCRVVSGGSRSFSVPSSEAALLTIRL
jgi:hypothetical protein